MSDIPKWKSWLEEYKASLGKMTVTNVPIDDMLPWGIRTITYKGKEMVVLCNDDQSFFWIEGVRVGIDDDDREVSSWLQPLLRKVPSEGFVGVATDWTRKFFIVQAKREPGYEEERGYTVLAPPMQFSASNLAQAHKGKKPQRYEWLEDSRLEMYSIPQDGGCFIEKINKVGFIDLGDLEKVQLLPNETIFSKRELKQAMFSGECNDHLLQTLGILFFD